MGLITDNLATHDMCEHDLEPIDPGLELDEKDKDATHVCMKCGDFVVDSSLPKPIPESRTMELQTIDQALEKEEHVEGKVDPRLAHMIKDEQLAEFIYDVQCAYRKAIGEEVRTTWESLPQEVKSEFRQEIQLARQTLAAPPEKDRDFAMVRHDQTFLARLHAGYRYGKLIDHEAKEHPDMVPFTLLPEKQRIKLYFGRMLTRLLAGISIGY